MSWQFNKTNLVCGVVALCGIAQFVYALVHAVRAFPGGYQVTEHFLSDLGRTVTANGQDNAVSAALFNHSVIWLGLLLIPFFAAMPSVLENGRFLVRVSGVLSACGLIGIGLTPYDVHLAAHTIALGCWIAPMLVAVVAFFASAELSGKLRTALFLGTTAVVLSVCAFTLSESHRSHVVCQKILAVLAAIWLLLVFVSVSVSTIQSFTSRRLIAEEQARQYIKAIERRHRRRY